MYKVGNIRWTFIFYQGKGHFHEWHLRTIRGGYIYFIRKNEFTWIKKSKKHFDYGWANNISCWEKMKIKITNPMDYRYLKPTKFSAVLNALQDEEGYFRRGWMDAEEIKDLEGLQKYVKRNAKRLQRKK